jgi:hypothetical protein
VNAEDVASRLEAEGFERRGDELIKANESEAARDHYRQAQRILMPTGRMWSDAVEYDLRMAAFQRIQEKLWAMASGGPVKPGVPGDVPPERRNLPPPQLPQPAPRFGTSEAARTFEASMIIDYEKWHDGIGYDLEALAQMTAAERDEVASDLLGRIKRHEATWRDTEALGALKTERAKSALSLALRVGDLETRLHVARELEEMGVEADIETLIGAVLTRGGFDTGVSFALSLASERNTARMRKLMLDCARNGDREVRVHAAAMCLYYAGQAKMPFDWDHRPFFLKFGEDGPERDEAYAELCRRIGDKPKAARKSKKP